LAFGQTLSRTGLFLHLFNFMRRYFLSEVHAVS
jgi:hypothetical protein